jgi:tetratricopeptide (TPR) repeat protein
VGYDRDEERVMNDNDDIEDPVDRLLDEAQALDDLEAAMPLYERALAIDSERAAVHYNIGLVHKYRGAWSQSLHHNRRASDLQDDHEAAHWNMGIAATALRDWAAAREAWRRVGIPLEDGEGPIQDDFGIAPVRLNPHGDGEVVWGLRIDPVRVVIGNIPYPASGFRAGDVVLHDGAPAGEREFGGRTYAVFNVLELFETSASSTYEAEVRPRDAADLAALTAALEAAGVEHEVWSTNVRMLCRQCSEGLPHDHHDQSQPAAWPESHVLGISATSPDAARRAIERWSTGGGGLLRFECALAGSPAH